MIVDWLIALFFTQQIQVTLPKIDAFERNIQRTVNQKYDTDVFDALLLRYESPQANNRWDSPLFNTLGCDLDQLFTQIQQALFDSRPPPPNMSTQAVSYFEIVEKIFKSTICYFKSVA